MKRILSIDGGGIRGIIPASTLVALEKQIGKPAREVFDFVAGTSTGALISAALAAGVSAEHILEIYTNRANEIFTPPKFIADAKRFVEGYSYDPANIKKVLDSEFGAAAKWVLNESPVRILITAKGIDTHAWYFVRSAPTYFSPWTIDIAGKPTVLVDGGVGVAGNPVYQACVEAFYFDDFTPADTRVVSLGTGFFPDR
jgi:patatin-like phospholipase/acyl hydrolase